MNVPNLSELIARLNLEGTTIAITEATTRDGLPVPDLEDFLANPETTGSNQTETLGGTQQVSNATSDGSILGIFQQLSWRFLCQVRMLAQDFEEDRYGRMLQAHCVMMERLPAGLDPTPWQNQRRVPAIFEACYRGCYPSETTVDEVRLNLLISRFAELESQSCHRLPEPWNHARLALACATVNDIEDWDSGMWHLFHQMIDCRKETENRKATQEQVR